MDRFSRVAVLDDSAETEDGEEIEPTLLSGLHAKIFVAERGWDTSITVGSGNATRPALLTGANVEVFATLMGKRSRLGGVDDLLGDKCFGRLTRVFARSEQSEVDAAKRAAEKRLDEARRALCNTKLELHCVPVEGDKTVWRLSMSTPQPLLLGGIGLLKVWPITRGEGHARDALELLRQGQTVDLGEVPLVDLTRFIAFQIRDAEQDLLLLFSTGLTVYGLPAERQTAILRSIINNKEAFFRYLRLLLSEFGDPFGAALAAQDTAGNGKWRPGSDDAPILEEMVRSFCRGGEQLEAIERLMVRLKSGADDATDPVPPEFRILWNTFQQALEARKVTSNAA